MNYNSKLPDHIPVPVSKFRVCLCMFSSLSLLFNFLHPGCQKSFWFESKLSAVGLVPDFALRRPICHPSQNGRNYVASLIATRHHSPPFLSHQKWSQSNRIPTLTNMNVNVWQTLRKTDSSSSFFPKISKLMIGKSVFQVSISVRSQSNEQLPSPLRRRRK